MFSQKSIFAFIRYYRLLDVTVLSVLIGGIYGIILYFTKLSAISGFIPSILLGMAVGLLIGYSVISLEFSILSPLMRTTSPLLILMLRIAGYSLISIFWIAVAFFLLYLLKDETPISEIADKFKGNKNFQMISAGSVVMIVIAVFFYQVSLLQSRNGLINYLLGRYAKPQRRKKIFMFLDLRNSTSHAETLGDLKFSSLLQDCFFDLAKPVQENGGDVYQYIGDEAVLVWDYHHPEQNYNCIRCFLKYRNTLNKRSEYYLRQYGFIPEFKAGLHGGEVVVVRVGEIKKEIAYHGDVLNTAARLESLCNQLHTSLVISGSLLKNIHLNCPLKFEQVPPIPLKGKEQSVDIFKLIDP